MALEVRSLCFVEINTLMSGSILDVYDYGAHEKRFYDICFSVFPL